MLSAPKIVPFFILACIPFLQACRWTQDPPWPAAPSDGEAPLRAWFIDVGQGDACLLRTPQNRFALYDVGNHPGKLIEFLKAQGVDTLQTVFISHPDLDHYGSFPTLAREFPVKKVFLPRGSSRDTAWQELLRALDELKIQNDTLFAGDSLAWEQSIHVKMLWPSQHFSGSDNDMSQVLRIEYQGHAILLTGDIESIAEAGMLAARVNLSAEILKVAHHGSRSSSGLPFLAAISPRWAVISCDSAVYGHPHRETLAGLEMVGVDTGRVLRTDRVGTVGFEIDARGIRRSGGRGQGAGDSKN